jgi:hypothetical protein
MDCSFEYPLPCRGTRLQLNSPVLSKARTIPCDPEFSHLGLKVCFLQGFSYRLFKVIFKVSKVRLKYITYLSSLYMYTFMYIYIHIVGMYIPTYLRQTSNNFKIYVKFFRLPVISPGQHD